MPETIWTSRREKKKKRLERVGGFSRGKVVPAEKNNRIFAESDCSGRYGNFGGG